MFTDDFDIDVEAKCEREALDMLAADIYGLGIIMCVFFLLRKCLRVFQLIINMFLIA